MWSFCSPFSEFLLRHVPFVASPEGTRAIASAYMFLRCNAQDNPWWMGIRIVPLLCEANASIVMPVSFFCPLSFCPLPYYCSLRPWSFISWSDVTMCDQIWIWQVWRDVTCCDQMWLGCREVTGVTSCNQGDQMWLVWPEVGQMWPALPVVTTCDQMWSTRERKSSGSLPSCFLSQRWTTDQSIYRTIFLFKWWHLLNFYVQNAGML